MCKCSMAVPLKHQHKHPSHWWSHDLVECWEQASYGWIYNMIYLFYQYAWDQKSWILCILGQNIANFDMDCSRLFIIFPYDPESPYFGLFFKRIKNSQPGFFFVLGERGRFEECFASLQRNPNHTEDNIYIILFCAGPHRWTRGGWESGEQNTHTVDIWSAICATLFSGKQRRSQKGWQGGKSQMPHLVATHINISWSFIFAIYEVLIR